MESKSYEGEKINPGSDGFRIHLGPKDWRWEDQENHHEHWLRISDYPGEPHVYEPESFKIDLDDLAPEEHTPLLSALRTAEELHPDGTYSSPQWNGRGMETTATLIDIDKARVFLEGFLERAHFPDDKQASALQAAWQSAKDNDQDTLAQAAYADYVGTVRGNLTWRVTLLKTAANSLITKAERQRNNI